MASVELHVDDVGMPGASGPSAGPGLTTVDVTEEVVFCSTTTVSPARLASSGLTMGGIPETPLVNSKGGECRSGGTGQEQQQQQQQFEDEEFFDIEEEVEEDDDVFGTLDDIEAEEDLVSICPCEPEGSQKDSRSGKLVWLTVDSGAGKSCTSRRLAEGYDIQPSTGSLNGQKFKGPGGEIYLNRGEVKFPMVTETGKQAVGEFQVIDGLEKTLVAVSDACDKGNISLFDNDGSFLLDRNTVEGKEIRRLASLAKRKINVHRRNGVYVMPVWVQEPGSTPSKAPFQRRGA